MSVLGLALAGSRGPNSFVRTFAYGLFFEFGLVFEMVEITRAGRRL